jgi:16S rRNA (uracil1498-N3)-methyltransferase
MAALYSFYLAPAEWREPYRLAPAEALHLTRALRLKAGSEVRLFDGQGRQGVFQVEAAERADVRLRLLSESVAGRPDVRCTLAAGFSKALRRGWFLEKAVELEAAAVWLWQGEYSQAALPDTEKAAWKASLVAGAKQCASAWLPELGIIRSGVEGLIERRGEFDRAFLLYEGDTGGRLVRREDFSEPGSLLLVVGPEGGFSPREAAALSAAGVTPVSLGNRVLRWETAAILTLGMAFWARQKP